VGTILDFFGDLGGLLEIVLGTGSLVTFAFVNRQFNASLVKEVYQVQRYTRDKSTFENK